MQNSNVMDISGRIDNAPKVLKITEDKKFVINDDKNTIIKVVAIAKKKDRSEEDVEDIIKLLLGDEGYEELQKMNLSYHNYEVVLTGLLAMISNISYEEAESRFQK